MDYVQALAIAEQTRTALAPYCERIEIAGSIRRQKPQVKDIEL
jgi:DNA polymerase/3'-5' exonuclease PolX